MNQLTQAASMVGQGVTQGASMAAAFTYDNPGTAALYAAGGLAAGVALAPAVVAGAGLSAVGFTGNGVAAGSFAAGWHSTLGSVIAPSLFSTLQSAAAGGYGVSMVTSGVSTVSGIIGAVVGGEAVRRTIT